MDDNEQVLVTLMEKYGKSVWRYIYAMTNDLNVADDITQDAFIKVYEHLGTFRNDASVKTWIFSITKNRCKDYFKSFFIKRVVLFWDVDAIETRNVEDEVL